MAGPWEEYQQQSGPWNEYQKQEPPRSLSSTANEMLGSAVNAAEDLRQGAVSMANETALPAVNQVIANIVGMPVDAVNAVLKAIGMGSEKPVGGSESIKGAMGAAGIGTSPDTSTTGRQAVADIAAGVATGAPFGPAGLVTGALSGAGTFAGREVGNAIGGETGAKVGELAGGLAAGGIPSAVKRVGAALAPTNPAEVEMLRKGGVTLTPGQTAGGEIQRVEEGATSIPGVGGSIKNQLAEAGDSFVRASINKALEPIGEKLPAGAKAGHEAVDEMIRATNDAYTEVLPRLKVIRDGGFDGDIAKAVAANLPGDGKIAREARETFADIVNSRIFDKFDKLGTMTGEAWKETERVLGKIARQYVRSDDPKNQAIGEALKDVQTAWRNMLSRANPEEAQTLNNINTAYAMQLRIERAADAAKQNGGKFTPAQLVAAGTSRSSSTVRESARGDALMQDWATAGQKVMGSKEPNSGTPFRNALRDIVGRPVAGSAGVASAFGMRAGLNAAIRNAERMKNMKTAPAVPFANAFTQAMQ